MDARPEIVEGKPRRHRLRSLLWVGLFAVLLFVPAGTVRWPGAWVSRKGNGRPRFSRDSGGPSGSSLTPR